MDLVHCGQKMKGWSLKDMTLVKSFVSAPVSFCYRYSFQKERETETKRSWSRKARSWSRKKFFSLVTFLNEFPNPYRYILLSSCCCSPLLSSEILNSLAQKKKYGCSDFIFLVYQTSQLYKKMFLFYLYKCNKIILIF